MRATHTHTQTHRTPIPRPPRVNGREIDLHKFYSIVCGRGGWAKVRTNRTIPFFSNSLSILKMVFHLFADQLPQRMGRFGARIRFAHSVCECIGGIEADLHAILGSI